MAVLIVGIQTNAFAQAQAQSPNHDMHYRLGPDSLEQEGVPKGEIRGSFTLLSKVFPGTQHTYWVYVPAQYDRSLPASLMVFNDGQAFMAPEGSVRAQNVLDIMPEMMRWLWRDHPVSVDPKDTMERSFNEPAKKPPAP